MAGFTTAAGVSVTQTTDTQQAPLGFEIVQPDGDFGLKTYVYIKADANISAGMVVQNNAAGLLPFNGSGNAGVKNPTQLLGIAHIAITANHYGFVVKSGKVDGVGDGTVGAGEPIVANGASLTGLSGAGADITSAIGVALTGDGGGANPVQVLLKL